MLLTLSSVVGLVPLLVIVWTVLVPRILLPTRWAPTDRYLVSIIYSFCSLHSYRSSLAPLMLEFSALKRLKYRLERSSSTKLRRADALVARRSGVKRLPADPESFQTRISHPDCNSTPDVNVNPVVTEKGAA